MALVHYRSVLDGFSVYPSMVRISGGIALTLACLILHPQLANAEVAPDTNHMDFSVSYTGNFLSNLSGGFSQGSSYTHELDIGMSYELTSNWSVATTGAWTQGKALSDLHVGDFGGL